MSSHTPRDDSSSLKPVVQTRKIEAYENVEEELAARNICNRKHGCHVLLSVPDAFTFPICQSTVSFLAGHDLYIPSEVEHARWYLEVHVCTSIILPSKAHECPLLMQILLQVISVCMSKRSELVDPSDEVDLIKRCIEILGRWLLTVSALL